MSHYHFVDDRIRVRCAYWRIKVSVTSRFKPNWRHGTNRCRVWGASSDPEPRQQPNAPQTHASIRQYPFAVSNFSNAGLGNTKRYNVVMEIMLIVLSSVGNVPMPVGIVAFITFRLDVLNDRTNRPIPAACSR